MSEREADDDEFDEAARLRKRIEVLEARERRLAMHLRVIASSSLRAAQLINDAPYLHSGGRMALNDALHNALIIAEECRQAMRAEPTP